MTLGVSNCDRFCAVIIVPTLYFLYIVNNASVDFPRKSGNSSIYKKFAILLFSLPGLLNTAFCIASKKNKPNALCVVIPKSPRLVHTKVRSPLDSISSKLIFSCLLHKIVFTPGRRNKLSNCVTAE